MIVAGTSNGAPSRVLQHSWPRRCMSTVVAPMLPHLVPEDRGDRLGIGDASVEAHGHRLFPGDNQVGDLLVGFPSWRPTSEILGDEYLHSFTENAGRHQQWRQVLPSSPAVAGLLFQLALSGLEGLFVGVSRSGGQFDERLLNSRAIVANETNPAILEEGEDDHCPRMEDHFLELLAALVVDLSAADDAKSGGLIEDWLGGGGRVHRVERWG